MTSVSEIPQSGALTGDCKLVSVHMYLFVLTVTTMIMTLSEPGLRLC